MKIKTATQVFPEFYNTGQEFEIEFDDESIYEIFARGHCDDDGLFDGDISLTVVEAWDADFNLTKSTEEKKELIYEYLRIGI